jgi:hypothetical protein
VWKQFDPKIVTKCPENVLKSTSRPTSLLSSTYGPSLNPKMSWKVHQGKLFPPVLMCLTFSSLSSIHWMVGGMWAFVCFSEHFGDVSWQFSGQIVSTCADVFNIFKAHISSFINLRTESKPENVKHISIYPKNTKKNIYIFFLGGNNFQVKPPQVVWPENCHEMFWKVHRGIYLFYCPVDWVQIWGCWVHWHIFNEYLKGKLKKMILGC